MPSKKQVILLVEDNVDDVDLTLCALKKNAVDAEVVVARDGAEALQYLFCLGNYAERDRNQTPTMVLLDLNLPKLNGVEVLRRIRLEPAFHLLPVIMLTSSFLDRDVHSCYESGANSYVQKPLEFQQIVESIGLVCKYWLSLNINPPPFFKKGSTQGSDGVLQTGSVRPV